mmetsp:Transcript_12272/g.30922  ORF Transcript_12272/g.30922 Transcript_12272/m.30922 type:complete len:306 (-) Transcript_12272:721-1638(-)
MFVNAAVTTRLAAALSPVAIGATLLRTTAASISSLPGTAAIPMAAVLPSLPASSAFAFALASSAPTSSSTAALPLLILPPALLLLLLPTLAGGRLRGLAVPYGQDASVCGLEEGGFVPVLDPVVEAYQQAGRGPSHLRDAAHAAVPRVAHAESGHWPGTPHLPQRLSVEAHKDAGVPHALVAVVEADTNAVRPVARAADGAKSTSPPIPHSHAHCHWRTAASLVPSVLSTAVAVVIRVVTRLLPRIGLCEARGDGVVRTVRAANRLAFDQVESLLGCLARRVLHDGRPDSVVLLLLGEEFHPCDR